MEQQLTFPLDKVSQDIVRGVVGLPVNSVYLTIVNENPATVLGYGLWEAVGTLTTSTPTTLYAWKRTL